MDGWNGHVCRNPESNRYCIGSHSYPGDKIRANRDIAWEKSESVAGKPCSVINGVPPCIYSINAFGRESLIAVDEPPDFFRSGKRTTWPLSPATVCVWPYEAMYCDEAKTNGRVDNWKRLELMKDFFSVIEPGKSLVFHYANLSNPFSMEDAKKYVVIGLSRVKKLGDVIYYEGTDEATKQKYGGAYVWQKNVETFYPDQGLRIPYHRYMDQPDILGKIVLIPENSRCFKYGSRHISDDDALSLIEQFIEIVTNLKDIDDDSENWQMRLQWLNGLIAVLWKSRGLYPGLPTVLDIIGLSDAVKPFHDATVKDQEKDYCDAIFQWLNAERSDVPDVSLSGTDITTIRRQWNLKTDEERLILTELLPRIDLPKDQMLQILSEKRSENGLEASLSDIVDNPYLLVEQYVGLDPDDLINFSRIDHAMFPSPELGGRFQFAIDDWQRLRVLCVDRLKYETKHTFISCGQLLQDVNRRLSYLPDWKRTEFTARYLEVDRANLETAIVFRKESGQEYAYLRSAYEAEREIEDRIRKLAGYSDISFKSPVTEKYWKDLLFEARSPLAEKSRQEYEAAIESQAAVCAKIFNRPVSVVCGAAGTGKTTIIRSILQAIEKAHGADATFLLLAPTGKAADRIREKTGKEASTIHSFLARRDWLNPNLTIKQRSGQREDKVTTFVIDEASMLDLGLLAAVFRAINWSAVQRIILVGDSNQLPPIGRGKVFSDIIDWLRSNHPASIGELTVNLRQMENRLTGKGTGILDLASVYVRNPNRDQKDEGESIRAEQMLQRLQDLPPDGAVDKDLRVIYWKDPNDLLNKLVSRIIADMEEDTGEKFNPEAAYKLWLAAACGSGKNARPDYHQVISPYRHEDFGTEAINIRIQQEARGYGIQRVGQLAGITLFDKVIQIRNRGASDQIWAYNHLTRQNELSSVFNGELGFVAPHALDGSKWQAPERTYYRIKRFQVRFSRKEHLAFSYGENLGYAMMGTKRIFLPDEGPEDNLELAYAISVHKSQGSEFERIYFVLPKQKTALLSPELFYTGITRATKHCTVLIEEDIAPLLKIHRPESSHLVGINCSLFDFTPAPEGFELIRREGFLDEGKIHRTLADVMVRSKSEVIIANMLFDRDIAFLYEKPLYAPDGSFYLPDFTIIWRGETFYWEHLGLLEREEYKRHWATKKAWYEKHFSGRLVTTEESGNLSIEAMRHIETKFS
jgi:ATP-dependent exoDNAse (exonuclease V) alpha subunit